MNKNKATLEKVSAISAFVIGIVFCFLFLISFLSALYNPIVVVESLLIMLFNAFLIVFGAQMGLKKEKPKARFSKMFHIIVLSFLGAMLYSVTPFFMLVYLLPTVTGTISLFYRDNAVCLATDANFSLEVSNSIVENNEEPKVETITEIKVSNKKEQNDFESKIVFLKNLRDKDLIDEEEYKREVSKILSEI